MRWIFKSFSGFHSNLGFPLFDGEKSKRVEQTEALKKNILPKSDFFDSLRVEKRRVKHTKAPLSIAVFTLRKDRNKNGFALKNLLESLSENTRETDIKGWIGTDVLGLLLPDTDDKGLQHCIKKVVNGNGNGNAPYSVAAGTYPHDLFQQILKGENRTGAPSALEKSLAPNRCRLYPQPFLKKKIREEKIRACRTQANVSLILFNPTKLVSGLNGRKATIGVDIAHFVAEEGNGTSMTGQWDRRTLGVLLLDSPPESAFGLIDKLTTRLRKEDYHVAESTEREVFQVFSLGGTKRITGSETENQNLSLNRRIRDLSTFHNLKTRHKLMKSILDIGVSSTLLALLSPLLLFCAVLIKIDSPGPVLYRQTRIGRGGRRFTFFKFRTMHQNSDERIHKEHVKHLMNGEAGLSGTGRPGEKSYKLTDDDRVSRLGRFLRKTSIDEIPQLINVLKADMTLVGPRPHPVYEAELYDVWHSHRLNIRPGVTGLGQVYGRFNTDYEDVYRLDLQYSKNASFLLDLKIIFKTFLVVFSGRGAY